MRPRIPSQASYLLLFVFVAQAWPEYRLSLRARLASGTYGRAGGNVLCCDSDHDSLQELIFWTGTIYPTDPLRWEVWEYRPVNHFVLAFADTGGYPYPPGITTGNFRPFDVGDIDQDGLTDMLGVNWDFVPTCDSLYNVLVVMESPDSFSYPESMVWSYRYAHAMASVAPPMITPDLDRDGRKELLFAAGSESVGAGIWENVADDSNVLVWNRHRGHGFAFTCGDFDQDSSREFVTADIAGLGTSVYECTGADQYELVFVDTMHLPNAHDVFSGNDLDQDGRPEFFVRFWDHITDTLYLYMWEGAAGNNRYQHVLVDRKVRRSNGDARSTCGDMDGDGVEELVWALPRDVFVYKAIGNNQFQEVWQWWDDLGRTECLLTNVHDMNGNGYNDLVCAGNGRVSMFEVEAIRVTWPDTLGELRSGDTCEMRWRIYTPPRCDSVSLFLKTDTVVPTGERFWRLDTIVTGLAPTESSYAWVVPDTEVAWAKVLAIVYGPGWQFDESDSAFAIVPAGIAAGNPLPPREWTLSVSPNPAAGRAVVRYDVPVASEVRLSLYDASGRVVSELASGQHLPGRYSVQLRWSGVYFVRFETPSTIVSRKVILIEDD